MLSWQNIKTEGEKLVKGSWVYKSGDLSFKQQLCAEASGWHLHIWVEEIWYVLFVLTVLFFLFTTT
jgi:hypothetical protein